MEPHMITNLIWALAVAVLIGPGVLAMYRGTGQVLPHAALWLGIFVAIWGAYELFT